MNRRRRILFRTIGCALIVVCLMAGTVVGLGNGWLRGFQLRASDSVFPRGTSDDVVVVGFDAASIDRVGVPWPWPRKLQADLLDKIADGAPKAVVYDVILAPAAEGDDEIAAAAKRMPLVLGQLMATSVVTSHGVLRADYASRPPDQLIQAADALGHTAITPDVMDGIVRRLPLVVDWKGNLEPSLEMAALGITQGDDSLVVRPNAVQIGNRVVPTEENHALAISWSADLSSTNQHVIPAADLLDGTVDPAVLEGKSVFVGVTDSTLGDHHLTPVNHRLGLAGVLIHANAYNTIVKGTYLADASTGHTVLAVGLLAIVAVLAVQFLPIWLGAILSLVSSAGYILWGLGPAANRGDVVNFVYPVLAALIAVMASGMLRYMVESRQRRLVSNLFSQYVPDDVATRILDDGNAMELARGIRRETTAFFCDLRGFTAMSAQNEPTDIRAMLDIFYEFATSIILSHDGTLVQYIGDEVYALFGVPATLEDHAGKAIAAAIEMQERRGELEQDLADKKLPVVHFGTGVNSGLLVAADMGSSWRRQYTAIGDTVNVAARLCSQAPAGGVLISDTALQLAANPPEVAPAGQLQMKGVSDDFVAWRWPPEPEPED